MAETTEKLTLRELETRMNEMCEAYEAKIAALEERLESGEKAGAPADVPARKDDAADWLNEEVPYRFFKDEDKYKDDITVGINGKLVKIRRGETVMIKRKYLLLAMQSEHQDAKTADMMSREANRFSAESRAYI